MQIPTRRSVLALLASCAAVLAWPASARRRPPIVRQDGPADVADRLAGLFRNRTSAMTVGRAYLRRHPDERTISALLGGLAAGADGLARTIAAGDPDRCRALVGARLRDDFACRRTVVLDGWIVSRTEARLCAVATLVWSA